MALCKLTQVFSVFKNACCCSFSTMFCNRLEGTNSINWIFYNESEHKLETFSPLQPTHIYLTTGHWHHIHGTNTKLLRPSSRYLYNRKLVIYKTSIYIKASEALYWFMDATSISCDLTGIVWKKEMWCYMSIENTQMSFNIFVSQQEHSLCSFSIPQDSYTVFIPI